MSADSTPSGSIAMSWRRRSARSSSAASRNSRLLPPRTPARAPGSWRGRRHVSGARSGSHRRRRRSRARLRPRSRAARGTRPSVAPFDQVLSFDSASPSGEQTAARTTCHNRADCSTRPQRQSLREPGLTPASASVGVPRAARRAKDGAQPEQARDRGDTLARTHTNASRWASLILCPASSTRAGSRTEARYDFAPNVSRGPVRWQRLALRHRSNPSRSTTKRRRRRRRPSLLVPTDESRNPDRHRPQLHRRSSTNHDTSSWSGEG